MPPTARLICGWMVDSPTFYRWCASKQIDVEELLSDPEDYLDTIPRLIRIQPIYPFPDTEAMQRQWGIQLTMCNGSFSSIQHLPPYVIAQAKEFYYSITTSNEEPCCHSILSYS